MESQQEVSPFERQLQHFRAEVGHSGNPPVEDLDALSEQMRSMNLSDSAKELVGIMLQGPKKEDAARRLEVIRGLITNISILQGVPIPEGLADITDMAELDVLLDGGTRANLEAYKGDVNWLGSNGMKIFERARLHSTVRSILNDLMLQFPSNVCAP